MKENFVCLVKGHQPCNNVDWSEVMYCPMHGLTVFEPHCGECGKIIRTLERWEYDECVGWTCDDNVWQRLLYS